MESLVNKVHNMHILDFTKLLPDNSIDFIITSPPYWGLRSYEGSETIWGGIKDCQHEWTETKFKQHAGRGADSNVRGSMYGLHEDIPDKVLSYNICSKCGGWFGQLGLEPRPQMYIDHITFICSEIKRILKPEGSFYLNVGSTYTSKDIFFVENEYYE